MTQFNLGAFWARRTIGAPARGGPAPNSRAGIDFELCVCACTWHRRAPRPGYKIAPPGRPEVCSRRALANELSGSSSSSCFKMHALAAGGDDHLMTRTLLAVSGRCSRASPPGWPPFVLPARRCRRRPLKAGPCRAPIGSIWCTQLCPIGCVCVGARKLGVTSCLGAPSSDLEQEYRKSETIGNSIKQTVVLINDFGLVLHVDFFSLALVLCFVGQIRRARAS